MRPTIRLRLALIQTVIFAVMATVLAAGIYALTAHSSALQTTDPYTRVEQRLGLPPGSLRPNRPMPNLPPRRSSLAPRRLARPPDSRTLSRVAAGVQSQTRSDLLAKLIDFSAALILAATFLTFIVGWIMAGRSLRPLRRITARAKTISEQDLHEPIALQGPHDELRELADTFDQMLARLDRAFKGQRLFAANASHELRTPLTRIRARLDVTLSNPNVSWADLERMADTIREAIDRSAALIDSLLVLARTDGGIERQPVAIDQITRFVLDDLQSEVSTRDISQTTNLAPCTVTGDPVLLEHLVRNVLDNAVTHNVDGGWMSVETQTKGTLCFRVSNGGLMVSRSSVDDLFIPLHRGHSDRMHAPDSGFGLGLAIVKAVAEAHHGRVRAEPLEEGGLQVEISLPAASHLRSLAGSQPTALGGPDRFTQP